MGIAAHRRNEALARQGLPKRRAPQGPVTRGEHNLAIQELTQKYEVRIQELEKQLEEATEPPKKKAPKPSK